MTADIKKKAKWWQFMTTDVVYDKLGQFMTT